MIEKKQVFKEKLFYILKRIIQWFIIVILWALIIGVLLVPFFVPIFLIVYIILIPILFIIIYLNHYNLRKYSNGNVIIHGSRGSGKGLLFQYLISKESDFMSNMYYGDNGSIVSPSDYFESIKPNTARKMLAGEVIKTDKIERYEGVNYYLDDANIYFPNYEDNFLKKLYPSISLFIPIQRHLYNSNTIINAQTIDRLYKLLRELQLDGYIKARDNFGFFYIWSKLPILRHFIVVKYRYHSKLESALNDVIPFSKLGLLDSSMGMLKMTSAKAMRETYKGEHGIIKDGFILLRKKSIKYDTRYFHNEMFGYKAKP